MKNFSVSEMFADHMVLCHSSRNSVWGTADSGTQVEVRLAGQCAVGRAGEDGRWLVEIEAPAPGTISTMEVRCGAERIVFEDVAAGEVWLAGGQSNMEMPVMCIEGGAELACASKYPDVRLRMVPRRCRKEPQYGWHFQAIGKEDRGWMLPDRDNVARISAIGYQFGALLSQSLHMPVGIIDCNWGGTKIQCWLPEECLNAYEDTRKDIEDFRRMREALGEQAEEGFRKYQESLKKVIENNPDMVERSLEDMMYYTKLERGIDFPPDAAVGDPQEPGSLYENMIARTAPYAIRGVLWYQGESNALTGEAERYDTLFKRLVTYWRKAWGRELPFLTCQLSAFDPFRWGDNYDWATLREKQALCADTMPGISMAVLVDVGDEKDIHPHRKLPVGKRLHDLALRDVYKLPAGDVFPPRPVSCVREGDALSVCFDAPVELREGDGLELHRADGSVRECEGMALEDRVTLRVSAEEPLEVWYGQREWFEASLFGANGEPVAPFRMCLPKAADAAECEEK